MVCKLLLLLALTVGTAVTSFAQQKGLANAGAEVAIPLGAYNDVYQPGVGVSLKYEIPATKRVFVTIAAAYTHFNFTGNFKQQLIDIGSTQSSAGFVPLKMGGKYYFNNQLFAETQVGVTIGTASGAGNTFVYSPGIGYAVKKKIELGIRYEAWLNSESTFGQLAIRAGYLF